MFATTDKMLTDAEKKHPKLVIGISGAVAMAVLVMGGQLTYQWGQMDRKVEQLHESQNHIRQAQEAYITRAEYQANNKALLREIQHLRGDMTEIRSSLRAISSKLDERRE